MSGAPDDKTLSGVQAGRRLLAQGDVAEAAGLAERMLQANAEDVGALMLLAQARLQAKAPGEALAAVRRGLALAPRAPLLRELEARVHLAREDRSAARAALQQALAHSPTLVSANALLAELLLQDGSPQPALARVQQALQAQDFAQRPAALRFRALLAGARAALMLGRYRLGLGWAQRARRLQPNNPAAMLVLGELLCGAGRRGHAAPLLRAVLAQQPNTVPALVRLGEALHLTDAQAESIQCFDRALALQPDEPVALVLSAAGRILSARVEEDALIRERLERFLELETTPLYTVKAAYWVAFTAMPLEYERRCWRAIRASVTREMAEVDAPPFVHRGRAHERIRVGYISPNFGNHGIGHVTHQLYQRHIRERFEVYVYPTNERPTDHSTFKQAIAETADHYRPLAGQRPLQMAQAIYADEIDILIDLNGYMGATNIIETCSLRPAPLQLYWLGHGGGMGLPYYDYIIGDPVVTPEADDGQYDDAVLRLPHCFAPASPYPMAEPTPSRADEGLAEDGFVFCAFNNPAKVSLEVFELWMRILSAVPDSQLWLSRGHNPDIAANLRAAAERLGVGGERLVFAQRRPDKAEHFARHRLAGLFLDTFNVNAATTCLDALWAGLPVLTRPGDHFCSRIAASMVQTAGLDELICESNEAYVDTAIALANDPARLQALRERAWEARTASPLFDIDRFVLGLEAGLTEIWARYQQGLAVAGVTVRGR
ncbi:MAG: tetratricopeptide repeat protein [Chromatiaceae bacterium]|nr:tetratricopeptide repeat protein [Chromatiaceae bacterium]